MLWVSLGLFLVLVAVMVLTLKAGVGRLGAALGESTAVRHRAAEHILETGGIPETWRPSGRVGERPPTPDEARVYLRRLDVLMRYFRRAPVFDTESTRAMLLDGLAETRERWLRGVWTR